MIYATDQGARWNLPSITDQPDACGVLWNPRLRVEAGCRGSWRAHGADWRQGDAGAAPARFVYLRDEDNGNLYSAPYEPVRRKPELFNFSVGKSDITWDCCFDGLDLRLQLSLAPDEPVELWRITVVNRSERRRQFSLYPCFDLGASGDSHQAAEYRPDLEGIVARSTRAPTADTTHFLLHEHPPLSWQLQRQAFAGEGGLQRPDRLSRPELACDDARQEQALAVLQYRLCLAPGESTTLRLLCGSLRAGACAVTDKRTIVGLRERFLSARGFTRAAAEYDRYMSQGCGSVHLDSPDDNLNHLVNHWLPRQLFFAAEQGVVRDRQPTAEYLQSQLGNLYLEPEKTRAGLLHALAQQRASGALPLNIIARPEAGLACIHQRASAEDCVWLVILLHAYLQETGDQLILRHWVEGLDGKPLSVFERVSRAMHWLQQSCDERGLCEPVPANNGACAVRSLMAAHGLDLWVELCESQSLAELAKLNRRAAGDLRRAVDEYLWDGSWYARGLTDQGQAYGSGCEDEGSLFLAPQSWALLANVLEPTQRDALIYCIHQRLQTPHGMQNMAPSYTRVRADLGELTQWHPGVADNGAIDGATAAFYAHSLYRVGEHERAFQVLRAMLPGPDGDDYHQWGQLPTFMPEAGFGAYHEYPSRTGRSNGVGGSMAAVWTYRALVEGLLGLQSENSHLRLEPRLPEHWSRARLVREYRGAVLDVTLEREPGVVGLYFTLDGEPLDDGLIRNLRPGRRYRIEVVVGQADQGRYHEESSLELMRKTA